MRATEKRQHIYFLILLFVFVISSDADSGQIIEVGRFSSATEGTITPIGWEPLIFKKDPRQTRYDLVVEDNISVIRAISDRSASGLTRKISIDLKEYPIVQWRWKVSNLIKNSDVHSKKGDDYAARLYIAFAYDPKTVGLWKRSKYQAGRLLFGDIPIAAINYIWETKAPIETFIDNAYTDFVKMIVVESGEQKVGQWVEEERNLYEDYKKAFGETPPRVNGVAIMTDTDNTGETATTYYGDIIFKKIRISCNHTPKSVRCD